MKIKIFLAVLSITVLWSCRKEFIIDYPPLPPTLVVNCLFTPDSIFNIQVGKLQNLNDTSDATVINAELTLYENDLFFEHPVFNSEKNTYTTEKKAQAGKTYTLNVKAEGFPDVVAVDTVPDYITIDSVNVYISAYYDSWEERNLEKVNLYFKNESENNYYEVLSFLQQSTESPPYFYDFPYGITSIDPVIIAEGILDQSSYLPTLIFSDRLLDTNAEITFMPFLQLGGWPVYTPSSYTILRNISKNYYLCRKKWFKYLQTNGLIQPDGIAQWSNMSFVPNPTDAYTNIENGLGIFASYTETVKLMTVKQ